MGDGKTVSISKKKVNELEDLLAEFCARANTVWAILTNMTGQLLAQRGFVYSFDVLAISALACGVFNSTMELAHIVGEEKFTQFLQEGSKFSIYYTGVDEDHILVSLFDDRTLPGVVKVASEVCSHRAAEVIGNGV